MENNTLNGFEAVFDAISPMNVGKQTTDDITKIDDNLGASEEMTDEELEAIRKSQQQPEQKEDEKEPQKEEKKEVKKETKVDKKDEPNDIDTRVNDEDDDDEDDDLPSDDSEATAVISFFDAISESLGWDDVEEDEKPKTAKDLVEYFRDVIEDNSKPNYASEEVEKLDEFVRNGGNLKDYFEIDGELDLDNLNIEDDEAAQKAVVKMLLKEKGFSSKQIDKKISKYEDAGLLEDEAQDALEDLKEIKQKQKEQLLENQQKQAKLYAQRQQEFFENVKDEIKGLDSIYGINIPEKDKKALLEYIFKPTSKGTTKYQEDYSKSLKNLVTSAYFTMKGDSIINIAKKEGKKDALDNFKNSLTKNTGVNKRSKRVIDTGNDNSIWDTFTRKLRSA